LIVTLEEEFRYPYSDPRCHLWFFEHGLSGYAWYVPKTDPHGGPGYVNVGIGGGATGLRAKGDRLRRHWDLLVAKLDRAGLVQGHEWRPRGHSYYLRQPHPGVRRDNALIVGDAVGLATRDMGEGIGPAIRSGVLAADAILNDTDYDIRTIARVSLLPSLRRLVDRYRTGIALGDDPVHRADPK
jgi:flavin-dependent dehydrogenase